MTLRFGLCLKYVLSAFVLLGFVGCESKPVAAKAAPKAFVVSASNEAEVEAVLVSLVKSIKEKDMSAIGAAFATEAFVDKVLEGAAVNSKDLRQFKVGMIQGIDAPSGGLGRAYVGVIHAQSLGVREINGVKRGCIRIDLESGGSDYLFFDLKRGGDGSLKIMDQYFFTKMTWHSEESRQLITPMLAELAKTPVEKIFSKGDEEAEENVSKMVSFLAASQEGDPAKTVALYFKLSPRAQKLRGPWMVYLACLEAGSDAYFAEVAKIEAAFPEDPGLAFTLMDASYYAEDYEGAARRLAIVESAIGEDSFLYLARANLHHLNGETEEALVAAKKAQKLDPAGEDPYWTLLTMSLAAGKSDTFLDTMKLFEKNFDFEMTEEHFDPDFFSQMMEFPEIKAAFK